MGRALVLSDSSSTTEAAINMAGSGLRCREAIPVNVNQNFDLIDYAYGDVGEPIRAGQTSSNDIATDKGSLGWLAVGALDSWHGVRVGPRLEAAEIEFDLGAGAAVIALGP
jgi:hypothetical protein